jgi:hypothetical protein
MGGSYFRRLVNGRTTERFGHDSIAAMTLTRRLDVIYYD